MTRSNNTAIERLSQIALTTLIFVLQIGVPVIADDDDDDVMIEPAAPAPVIRNNRVLVFAPDPPVARNQQFQQTIFGLNQDEQTIRSTLARFLSKRIESLDAQCKLSDEQRQRLLLAGRGDIKRVFDRVGKLKREFETATSKDETAELWRQAFQLRPTLNSGYSVFGGDAMLTKAIRHVLTDEQRPKYDELRLTRKEVRIIQPNRISFGMIREGAIGEAGCRLLTDGGIDSNAAVVVNSPAFLNSVQGRVQLLDFQGQNQNRPGACDVNFSLSTSTPGEFEGTIQVLIGNEWFAQIPVAATILAHQPGLRRVLIVDGPFHWSQANDASLLEPWLKFVNSRKLDVNYLNLRNGGSVLRDLDLSKFDVVVMGETGLLSVNGFDCDRLNGFVSAGGRLIVTTNSEFRGTAAKANLFLSTYGLKIEDKGVPSRRFVPIECLTMANHPLTKNVGKLTFVGPSTISIDDAKERLILVDAPPFPEFGYAAIATIGKGSVVVLGSSSCWNWIGRENINDSDNAVFLKNLMCEP